MPGSSDKGEGMADADLVTLIGLYIGAFALGWTSGLLVLAYRKFTEGAT